MGGSVRKRLGEVLVAAQVLTAEQLQAALSRQAEEAVGGQRKRLGQVVTAMGMATELEIATALASQLKLEIVDLRFTTIPPDLARLVPRQVATRAGVVVLERLPNGLKVATSDPTNVVGLDDVRMYAHARELVVCVAQESQILEVHARTWSLADEAVEAVTVLESLDADAEEDLGAVTATDDAPTVRVVNMILSDAVRAGASDIHVEPLVDCLRIRFRVDGLLRDVMTAPKSASASVISRLKVTSGLDIAERRVPQDGRTRIVVEGLTLDARVSSMPNLHGEKIVIRLLSRADDVPEVTGIGLLDSQLTTLREALESPQGLVLITGPTGSGKTNTLYAALSEVNTVERNIITLEDPVEIQMRGITQVQVHERAGMTFSRGLRAVLRQDPDIVLVGEIRDAETAELALQASLTGHLVLSTLHTNDAVAALTRMVDMGVEPYLVGSSLSVVVAQRLVRRPCTSCSTKGTPDPDVLARLGLEPADVPSTAPLPGEGCAGCGSTGYKGRLGLFEVLSVTPRLRRIMLDSPTESAIASEAAFQQMVTLRSSGLAAVTAGETTYEEVLRATPADRG